MQHIKPDRQPKVRVPKPLQQPSSAPNNLTSLELADLGASKRNVIIYERRIDELNHQVSELSGQKDALQKELLHTVKENGIIQQLKRGKTEMYVSTVISSILMAVGGGLISSFPITPDKTPWQFAVGWTLLGLAVLLGTLIRPIVWFVFYKFVSKKEQSSILPASAD